MGRAHIEAEYFLSCPQASTRTLNTVLQKNKKKVIESDMKIKQEKQGVRNAKESR
jgi:hypothetical protein